MSKIAPETAEYIALISKHQSAIYAFVRAMVGNAADAEDIVQETNIALWTSVKRFNEGSVSQLVRAAENHDQSGAVPGDRLTLEHGAVELTFPNGVRAVIEAPAEIEFAEGNALKLDHGTGYFRIERPEAAGFTLTLPHSEVVDLGTSFGVIAAADGPAEVHLIAGGVRMRRRAGSFEAAAELQPGQACREDDTSATGYSLIPFRKDRFARQLPSRHQHVAIDFDRVGGDGIFATSGSKPARVREVIVNNGRILRVPGRFGDAVRFDGSGSHLEILGWAESHHRPSGTLSFWVRMPGARHLARYCPVSWGSTERDDVGRWSVAIEPRSPSARLAIRAGMDQSYHLSAEQQLGYRGSTICRRRSDSGGTLGNYSCSAATLWVSPGSSVRSNSTEAATPRLRPP